MRWLAHLFGTDNGNDPVYLFYSGLFAVLVFAGGQWASYRHKQCHEPWCLRVGRYPVEGTAWSACRKHHPAPPHPGDIRRQHHLYLGKKPGRG